MKLQVCFWEMIQANLDFTFPSFLLLWWTALRRSALGELFPLAQGEA